MAEGVVVLDNTQDRAVFLTNADLATLREMLKVIDERPTVSSGQLDQIGLERLSHALELAEEGADEGAPIVLSTMEEEGLELLKDQATIRSNLPMRIRLTCRVCGYEQLINPAKQAHPKPSPAQSDPGVGVLATSVDLFAGGHPVLAALNFFIGSSSEDSSAPAPDQPSCRRCEGEDLDKGVVTFCPGCRAVRDESVLLTCPECDFDFRSKRSSETFWLPPEKAIADATLTRNVSLLREKALNFENKLWPGQLEALIAALRTDELLLAMCRCGIRYQFGRYVALLLTSKQLVWARQSPVSETTSGNVLWSNVLAIRKSQGSGPSYAAGIMLETSHQPPLVFSDFRGAGVAFTGMVKNFTVDAILAIMNDQWQPYRPAVVASGVPAAPPSARPPVAATPGGALPPQPALADQPQPQAQRQPQPGWYPDPWRTARLRWWNGTHWTGYLAP